MSQEQKGATASQSPVSVGRPASCDRNEVSWLAARGMSRYDIAERCGTSYWAVSRVLRRAETKIIQPQSDARLCMCGCGEEINPRYRQVVALKSEGLTNSQIAREIGISSKYVSVLLAQPPRYLKGHYRNPREVTLKWVLENAMARKLRNSRIEREAVLRHKRWDAERDARRAKRAIAREVELRYRRQRQEAKRAERLELRWRQIQQEDTYRCWRRFVRAVACVARLAVAELGRCWRRFVRAVACVARLAVAESQRLLNRWTTWATREQRKHIREQDASRARAKRAVERRVRSEERAPEASLLGGLVALDAALPSEEGDMVPQVGASKLFLPLIEDPVDLVVRDETATRLRAIVGDMDADDVARLDASSLARLQDRLRDEGLVHFSVTDSERERLRDPNRHSGGSIAKSPGGHSGRRTRKQQIAVTRDHHVRELTGVQKKAHAAFRSARVTALITGDLVAAYPDLEAS